MKKENIVIDFIPKKKQKNVKPIFMNKDKDMFKEGIEINSIKSGITKDKLNLEIDI